MADQLGFGPGDELSWMNTYFLIGGCFQTLVYNERRADALTSSQALLSAARSPT